MSYMSRAFCSLKTLVLVLFSSNLSAQTLPIAENGRPTCYGWNYIQERDRLQANWQACHAAYMERVEVDTELRSSYSCGAEIQIPAKADEFARSKCPLEVEAANAPPRSTVLTLGAGTVSAGEEGGGASIAGADPNAGGEAPNPPPIPRPRDELEAARARARTAAEAEAENRAPAPEAEAQRETTAPRETANPRETAPTTTQNTTPRTAAVVQDPGPAQYEAQNDINACASAQSQASRCCGNPQACTGSLAYGDQQRLQQMINATNQAPPSGQGLTEYCAQMNSLTSNGRGINNMFSSICSSNQGSCTSTCGGLVSKYQSLMASCSGCAAAGVYSQAYNTLMSYQSSCASLSGRAQQIAMQANANMNSGAYANACSSIASPQGLSGGIPEVPKGGAGDRLAGGNGLGDCDVNPNPAVCRQLKVSQSTDPAGTAGFGAAKKEDKPTFNLPDGRDIPVGNGFAKNGVEPQSVTNKMIPNNSGGGIPGSGGTNPASLGANPKGASPGSPGYETDIYQGMLAGGYSQPGPMPSMDGYNPRQRGGARRGDGSDPSNPMVGMDLKQFLPGGSLDPNRKIAGVGRGSQINPKEENIWRIISNKINEKCRLGVLWRCGPEFERKK